MRCGVAAAQRDGGAQGAGLVPVHRRRRRDKPAGVLSGGEKTRLALATLVVVQRQRAAARRADEQPRPGQPRAGARRAAHVHGRDRAGHARRGRGRGARARAGDPAARRRRGPLERDLADLVASPDIREPRTRTAGPTASCTASCSESGVSLRGRGGATRAKTKGQCAERDPPTGPLGPSVRGGFPLGSAGEVATITLNRPDRLNAQNPHTWTRLVRVAARLPGTVRVVVLRGSGRAFPQAWTVHVHP